MQNTYLNTFSPSPERGVETAMAGLEREKIAVAILKTK